MNTKKILDFSARVKSLIARPFLNLKRIDIAKIATIGLILGIVLFPWPPSESYGQFKGFDPNNVYVQQNSEFAVQLDSTKISVESLGPGEQIINLAQSDLPYKISFSVVVQNESAHSDPARIGILYPLNLNRIYILFSSLDHSMHLELIDSTGTLAQDIILLDYVVRKPVSFLIEVSTFQSSREFISVKVDNSTSQKTVNFTSEVRPLLEDQSRLISLEIMGTNDLLPDYLSLQGNNFWNVRNVDEGEGNSTLVQLENTFSIVPGNYSENYIEHFFESGIDLTPYKALGLTINGSGTSKELRLWLNSNWNNRYFFRIQDDFIGQKTILLSLEDAERTGNPRLASIDRIGIDFPNVDGVWSFSDIKVGTFVNKTGIVCIDITDLEIDILPHSLAYAPLTTAYVPASLFLVTVTVIVAVFFHKDFRKILGALRGRPLLKISSRTILFILTLIGVFGLYYALFSLGDHAFDMFSQKLWSYDIGKYGLLSIYQRPAMTSAAAMYKGESTMHAIFAYSPLAALYYTIIGKTYFLISSNVSAYDQILTIVMKSFQTMVTLACGFLSFKIMRRYGASWRNSFLIMVAFLVNPLVVYDAAVWGHQDALLIFFLLLSLWSFESNHQKTAFASLALAIMVKSTAFAPAILMTAFLIKKFGLKSLIDGILTGLVAGIAIIIPFVVSGVSPAMFINSTVFRVIQFGIPAFQYPRSAAVSPDGYSIWPLITYFTGATSRERMWYPDFLKIPFLNMSYMVAGEILFFSVLAILIYLSTKKNSTLPGGPPLLLGVLMVASTIFLTKMTARYLIFGVAYLIISYNFVNRRTKWLVVGLLTLTSILAMHGLLVWYTGEWLQMYPAMSPTIPMNGLILSLYESDVVITEMILVNVFAFIAIFAAMCKRLNRTK